MEVDLQNRRWLSCSSNKNAGPLNSFSGKSMNDVRQWSTYLSSKRKLVRWLNTSSSSRKKLKSNENTSSKNGSTSSSISES